MGEDNFINLNEVDFHWAEKEYVSIQLGDKRLQERLITITQAFMARPQGSIPEAMGDWAKSKAAYRFFDNKKVHFKNILTAHREATHQRLGEAPVLLAIQDTSFIDYTSHPATADLGLLADESHRGLIIHPTLLSSPEGIPLGLIDLQLIKREEIGSRDSWYERPIAEKESRKWLESFRATQRFAKEHPGTRMINVGDREGDVYELFQEAIRAKEVFSASPDVLIRASWNRKLQNQDSYLWEFLDAREVAGTVEIELARNHQRSARRAVLDLRYAQVQLRPPRRCMEAEKLQPLTLWAVYAEETKPPKGEEPVSWMLLTTVEIPDCSQAMEALRWYVRRWLIETYFKVLKSGCQIEERQLQAEHRLVNCLAVDCIVAWRILFLTMIGRELPDLSATVIFEKIECQALYGFVHQTTQAPSDIPTLGKMILEIGKLGGFLARTNDKNPGIASIWRGMWRLADITAAWKIFSLHHYKTYG